MFAWRWWWSQPEQSLYSSISEHKASVLHGGVVKQVVDSGEKILRISAFSDLPTGWCFYRPSLLYFSPTFNLHRPNIFLLQKLSVFPFSSLSLLVQEGIPKWEIKYFQPVVEAFSIISGKIRWIPRSLVTSHCGNLFWESIFTKFYNEHSVVFLREGVKKIGRLALFLWIVAEKLTYNFF